MTIDAHEMRNPPLGEGWIFPLLWSRWHWKNLIVSRMRFLPWLLMIPATASAKNSASNLLERGMIQAVAGMAPVPAQDKSEVLAATADVLSKHLTFRTDGTASAFYTQSGRRPVEWKGFVIRHITHQAVTEADRLNGITNRCLVSFGCDAHRSLDSKTNARGEWFPIGNVTFPSALYFEWKNGAWAASLPPGMTRGK